MISAKSRYKHSTIHSIGRTWENICKFCAPTMTGWWKSCFALSLCPRLLTFPIYSWVGYNKLVDPRTARRAEPICAVKFDRRLRYSPISSGFYVRLRFIQHYSTCDTADTMTLYAIRRFRSLPGLYGPLARCSFRCSCSVQLSKRTFVRQSTFYFPFRIFVSTHHIAEKAHGVHSIVIKRQQRLVIAFF